jgi:hypothetical protein
VRPSLAFLVAEAVVVLIDNRHRWQHLPWALAFALGFAGATLWFVEEGIRQQEWPGGAGLPGFTFGVVGGLLILFEMLLWVRKWFRRWRLARVGSAQGWLRAHIWMGLLCGPLLAYHSGGQLGGPLTTVLMVLLLVVIASGGWGLILQQYLPRRLLEDIPAETIYAQIDELSRRLTEEAGQMVQAVCGPPRSAAAPVLVADAEPLRTFFVETAAPFLRTGKDSPLTVAARATQLFADLRKNVPPDTHDVVAVLEDYCDRRRQWTRQARLHFWLHNWLWVHFPLSVALVVLMVVHAWVAIKYW